MTSIKDVARLAGVSVATVSRTLAKPEKVAAATQEKVMKAVQKVGYLPNQLASNFRRRQSQKVIVLVPDIANPFYATIIQEIELVARERGYRILLGETRQSQEMEQSYGEMCHQKMADGIISLGMHIPFRFNPRRKTVDPNWPPVVMACEYMGQIPVPTIAIDNVQAAYDATRLLLELGHKDIALINGRDNFSLCSDRLKGFSRAVKRVKKSRLRSGEFSLEFGYEAACSLLADKERPTAIVCASDELAIGAMNAARKLGLSVPRDLSVTGFDDISFAAYSSPPLTTIRQPMKDIGRHAMAVMLDLLNGSKPAESRIVLPHELIVRESTAVPPSC